MRAVFRVVVIVLALAGTAAADEDAAKIPVTPPAEEVLGAEAAASSSGAAPLPLEQPIDPNTYVCGPGDVFELNFWGQQNFRLKIAADVEGRVFISKVGFVAIAGKTLTAVRNEIKAKVRGTYPGLKFDVTLVNLRSFLVHAVGNVKSPGTYSSDSVERVSSVLAHAGGVTGSRRRISIKHRDGKIDTADLVKYELTGETSYNPFLLDGDVVRVPFAELTVTISGAVHRPGTYELVKSKDLTELFELAGGLATTATRSLPVRIVRSNEREHEGFVDVPFAGSGLPNATLRDGDSVLVRGTEEFQRSVLLIGAVAGADTIDQATTSRRLPFVEGDTALSLITRAGGIKSAGDLRRSYIARPRPNAEPELIALDLEALIVQRNFKADKPVKMGDTIVVPPLQYSVFVEGAVSRPGLYNYNPLFGMNEYIARAGGRSRTARDLDDTKLIDSGGAIHDYRSDLKPKPGDSILVPERNFTRAEVVQLVLAGAGLVLSGITVTYLVTK
jgi:protein involved in polysaccharide export with SLBB domain